MRFLVFVCFGVLCLFFSYPVESISVHYVYTTIMSQLNLKYVYRVDFMP